MKRNQKKKKKNNIKQKTKTPTPYIKFTEKKINKFSILILVSSLIIISLVAFFNFYNLHNLFYFKDIGSDSLNQNYPALVHLTNLFKNSWTNYWSFYSGLGEVFTTKLPSEPIGWIIWPINKIGINTSDNFLIFRQFYNNLIQQLLFSGILFFLYLRTINLDKFSAIIGGLTIAFSGYMIVGSGWGFSEHIFKASLLLFSFEQLYQKKRWYFFPLALLYLGSNPYILFIYSLFIFLYSIFRLSWDNQNKLKQYLNIWLKMIFFGAIGLLMKIQSLWNAFEKMYNSPRVSGNASYISSLSEGKDIVAQTSVIPTTILRTFSSDLLGTGNAFKGWYNYLEAPLFYIGLLALLMAPQVFIHLNKRKKIVFGSFAGFWILTLIFPYLRRAMLAFTGDYYRYGFDFFIPFTILFFAIYALNELDKTFKLNIRLLAATFVILIIALFFPYSSLPRLAIDKELRSIIVFFLFIYSIIIFFLSKPKYKSYAQIALLLTVVVELSYFSHKSYEKRVPVTKLEYNFNRGGYKDGTIKAVNYLKQTDSTKFYRTEKDYFSGNAMHGSLNDAMAQGYYGTSSYSSFNQLNYVRFLEETEIIEKGNETQTRWIVGLRNYPLYLTFANIKYFLSKSAAPQMASMGFDSLIQIDNIKILKNRYSLPFGYTYNKQISFDEFKKLSKFHKELALLNACVVDDKPIPNFKTISSTDPNIFVPETKFTFGIYKSITDSLKQDSLTITSFKQSNIKGHINLDEQKILFFTIPYDEGWNITIDGQKKQLQRYNIGFTGILIPKGKHSIELNFVPQNSQITSKISIITILLFWSYLIFDIIRKRKKRKLDPLTKKEE